MCVYTHRDTETHTHTAWKSLTSAFEVGLSFMLCGKRKEKKSKYEYLGNKLKEFCK